MLSSHHVFLVFQQNKFGINAVFHSMIDILYELKILHRLSIDIVDQYTPINFHFVSINLFDDVMLFDFYLF